MSKRVQITIISFVAVILVVSGALLGYKRISSMSEKAKAVSSNASGELSETVLEEYEEDTYKTLIEKEYMNKKGEYNVEKIKSVGSDEKWQFVHQMTHNVVNADDKWGEIVISDKSIGVAKLMFEGADNLITTCLEQWNNLTFNDKNTVDLHNYVWSKLRGTIGKADSMSDSGVKNTIKLLEGSN